MVILHKEALFPFEHAVGPLMPTRARCAALIPTDEAKPGPMRVVSAPSRDSGRSRGLVSGDADGMHRLLRHQPKHAAGNDRGREIAVQGGVMPTDGQAVLARLRGQCQPAADIHRRGHCGDQVLVENLHLGDVDDFLRQVFITGRPGEVYQVDVRVLSIDGRLGRRRGGGAGRDAARLSPDAADAEPVSADNCRNRLRVVLISPPVDCYVYS